MALDVVFPARLGHIELQERLAPVSCAIPGAFEQRPEPLDGVVVGQAFSIGAGVVYDSVDRRLPLGPTSPPAAAQFGAVGLAAWIGLIGLQHALQHLGAVVLVGHSRPDALPHVIGRLLGQVQIPGQLG